MSNVASTIREPRLKLLSTAVCSSGVNVTAQKRLTVLILRRPILASSSITVCSSVALLLEKYPGCPLRLKCGLTKDYT